VPFVSGEAKYQVSTAGGWLPRFSRSNELFFATTGNRLMVAQNAKRPNFHIDSIRSLFQLDLPNLTEPLYDATTDGSASLCLLRITPSPPPLPC
jgi:hypothetical protein